MTTMKTLFILLLSTALVSTTSAQQCEAPSSGCTYGMFNYEKCICECIKPYCPDANGDCVVPLDNCGGNPWEDCTRGVNCPWWGSLSSGDMCNTGSRVPAGVWKIFNTREICCGVHAPFSSVCNDKGPNGPVFDPNNPSITPPSGAFGTEDVTLKFALNGLPNDMDIAKLTTNVLATLNYILAQLKEREPDLQVTGINERACRGRKLGQQRQLRMVERELLRDASICYTVEVENRDSGQDYEALLVTEARASSDVVLDEIRTKLNYMNVGVEIGSENGNGGSGSGGSNPSTSTMSNANGNGGGGDGDGLPGWGVALIVILLLLLSCCIGYCIFDHKRNSKDEKDSVHVTFNDAGSRSGNSSRRGNPSRSQYGSAPPRRQRSFVDRGSRALRQSFSRRPNRSRNERNRPRRRDDERRRRHSRYGGFRSSVTDRIPLPRRSRGDRSRRDNDNEYPSISLSNPQDPKFAADELTVNTYTTNKKIEQHPQMNALAVYEPDYAKPDPDGETAGAIVLALTNGEDSARNYAGEPNTKPKLEPEEMLSEAAPLRSRRRGRNSSRTPTPDPSVDIDDDYTEPPQVLYGSSGDASDDEDEYDQYGFRSGQPQKYAPKRQNKRSKELEESFSFATEDPEDERRQARKKRKKRKKKERRESRSNSSKRYDESRNRQNSGVDSVESEVGSIELESRASA
mmetsp:Transcript_34058/g.69507  ORF Transcript_34058/g.69507 Transcript_34058/m.69507 type:complete len:687 (+) Transcript_34058:234-2294(+)